MPLYTASLNSGSNGNCYFIGNDQDAILIDAGLSCRETERRMHQLDLHPGKVNAIFISHEHVDHIKGVAVLSERYQIPVYVSLPTAKYIDSVSSGLLRHFSNGDTIPIGSLAVQAFAKKHDAVDPHSFVVSAAGVHIGVFTDIGRPCDSLIHYFSQCHAAYLESNYDEDMLENGRYPLHLKNRIRGGEGHLSNRQALDLFLSHRSPSLTHLFLSHLSEQNNDPDKALQLFAWYRKEMHISIASRYKPSELYTIQSDQLAPLQQRMPAQVKQMNLF